MAKVVEENALVRRQESTGELATTAAAALAQHEIQSAIVIARQFPRNEDQAFAKLMRACKRTSFAEDAQYSFPRGDQRVTGPSVNLAREAARVWGNIRYGLYITRDDEDTRQIRGSAWDVETNTKIEMEDDFQKLIYRKKGGWVRPDERDLRELTNRRGAILVRNSLLQLLPKDLIEDALAACNETLKDEAKKDPDAARKKIIIAFSELNITPQMLEEFLEHPLSQASPTEIADLRTIYASIRDGNSKWHEYMEAKTGGAGSEPGKQNGGSEKGSLNIEDLKAPDLAPAQPAPAAQPSAPAQPAGAASLAPAAQAPPPADKPAEGNGGGNGNGTISQDEFTVLLDAIKAHKKVREVDVLAFAKQCAFERGKNLFQLTKLERVDYQRVLDFIESDGGRTQQ